ncbi:flavin reductase family protein [Vibrio renipiscarius]|uniref:Protein/domain typically associated with flavoprotein oxygenase, DIM6/NTAB family protein n=1 Tax=Vibrio renipiscarius TaxID=1461322 RepID=A0A0C2JD03_9VIBR|nr:flavin reductase family protein [Vibrio renipiscarius]KII75779.1 protein/domain typically associated with flavoprotein oxygenase, DIM6/NTAB family protein [Vibrio renipiscarius]KII81771.1 protein/domain typically associated with flavoprotein oxygenase, DIM6/NTAB family protein [Vibrio renipiscarius]
MNIEMSTLAPSQVYHLLTQAIIPRPVAWVLTESGSDNYNLAPFSYFAPVSSQPALLMFSVGHKPDGEMKDTVRNVLETGRLVIHIASADLANTVTQTAASLPHGESEVEECELELCEFEGFELPRVKACSIAFACKLYEIKELGDAPQYLVFAEIEQAYLDPRIIDHQTDRLRIDAMDVNPLCRLGGGDYAVLEKTFSVSRPK